MLSGLLRERHRPWLHMETYLLVRDVILSLSNEMPTSPLALLVVFGGLGATSLLNDAWELSWSSSNPKWRLVALAPSSPKPIARCSHQTAIIAINSTSNILLMYGGTAVLNNNAMVESDELWKLTLR